MINGVACSTGPVHISHVSPHTGCTLALLAVRLGKKSYDNDTAEINNNETIMWRCETAMTQLLYYNNVIVVQQNSDYLIM